MSHRYGYGCDNPTTETKAIPKASCIEIITPKRQKQAGAGALCFHRPGLEKEVPMVVCAGGALATRTTKPSVEWPQLIPLHPGSFCADASRKPMMTFEGFYAAGCNAAQSEP